MKAEKNHLNLNPLALLNRAGNPAKSDRKLSGWDDPQVITEVTDDLRLLMWHEQVRRNKEEDRRAMIKTRAGAIALVIGSLGGLAGAITAVSHYLK